ncbi:MAG: hybrid sensor histidine kinase/response regulator [Bradyrhizobiaceae bacterium]|nr:hybrid sensor histidine kinase/response regulator [Bradyrhizobiaceae bacterium]
MASTSPKTILLIDGNPERRAETAHTLLDAGLSVLVASDLQSAQALVRHHRPSAIVLDSAFLAFRDLREKLYIHGLNVDTPFVVLADDSEPLSETSVPYGVISRPITEAGIHSLMAIQGLPVAGEVPPVISPVSAQPSLLYALPHEYRTPLTDIIGQASYLHGHARDIAPEDIREVSAEVLSAARRLLRVTDNFLVYAQIETLADSPLHIDRMRQCTTREPAAIVYDTAIQRALAHERQQDLTIALDIEGIPLAMMEQHLDKITGELIDNALYFSRQGSPVTFTATPTSSDVTFTIRDHGVGMQEQELLQIGAYRQFRRKTQEQQGIGLGLVIAKRLVELHGGTFTISSALGMGTSITFNIPRAA